MLWKLNKIILLRTWCLENLKFSLFVLEKRKNRTRKPKMGRISSFRNYLSSNCTVIDSLNEIPDMNCYWNVIWSIFDKNTVCKIAVRHWIKWHETRSPNEWIVWFFNCIWKASHFRIQKFSGRLQHMWQKLFTKLYNFNLKSTSVYRIIIILCEKLFHLKLLGRKWE